MASGTAVVDHANGKFDDDESGALVIPASSANNILDQPDASECAGTVGVAKIAVLDQWPVLRLDPAYIEKHVPLPLPAANRCRAHCKPPIVGPFTARLRPRNSAGNCRGERNLRPAWPQTGTAPRKGKGPRKAPILLFASSLVSPDFK
ncbi:hypothetical protein [Mesorhizobium sp.]|uniref:hypothetical protein n=1 Tax=Mesorhizobium sp. TaxID=1871066 RepID=UPI000FE82339|nr:hypothetical protein [Mesorhizobium sp.]RWP73638.1 MAG: hypothetical protein EOR09_18535 [Mesorhizobium sp.]